MYARYLKERENKEMLQTERGFAIYGYDCVPGVPFKHVYLQDVYVLPDSRKQGVGSKISDLVAAEAKSKGYGIMISSLDCRAKNPDVSLKALQAYGMKLYAANDNAIYMVKEL